MGIRQSLPLLPLLPPVQKINFDFLLQRDSKKPVGRRIIFLVTNFTTALFCNFGLISDCQIVQKRLDRRAQKFAACGSSVRNQLGFSLEMQDFQPINVLSRRINPYPLTGILFWHTLCVLRYTVGDGLRDNSEDSASAETL